MPFSSSSALPPSAGFHFGQQQVLVSGPPMHQQLFLHPDGTLTTRHSPQPSAIATSPVDFAAAAIAEPGQGALLEKYKRAKKLLQGQLHDNETLRQQLAAETRCSETFVP